MEIKFTNHFFFCKKKLLQSIMRIFLLLFCTTVFSFSSSDIFSQNTKVLIDEDKVVSIDEIFDLLREQTQYTFIYQEDLFKDFSKVSLKKGTILINDLLRESFLTGNYNFEFTESNKIIVSKIKLVKKDEIQFQITGTVSDSNGVPLPGASVLEKGTTTGAQADFDGNFTLSISSGNAVLVVSYIGYATKEVTVNNQSNIKVALVETASALDEVVVVGYGTQKKVNLTGSISTVKASQIENRPITSATQLLSGLASGVSVSQTSGRPGGDDATIRIRGIGTLGNNNPLVLVDGIPGRLSRVNPADVETVTVLKDAASTSIYGSRAANGVILVTTKKGKVGKMTVDYDFYTGVQEATKLTDFVTNSAEFMELYNLALFNADPTSTPRYSQTTINEFRNGTDPYIHPNTDWNALLYRTANISSHNVRISGGNDINRYSFSLGYIDQDGILLSTNTKKYNFNFNLNSKVSEKFNYSLIVSGRGEDVAESAPGSGTLSGWVNRALPYYTPYLEDGRYGNTWDGNASQNSLAGALEGGRNTGLENYALNVSAEYEFIEGLKYKGIIGIRRSNSLQKRFIAEVFTYNPKTFAATAQSNGGTGLSAHNNANKSTDLTFISTLTYDKTIAENHNISALAGFQQETSRFDYLGASINGLPSNALQEIDAGSLDPTASGGRVDFGLQSFFGRVNYNYMEKYLFEANVRYDGSSNFGAGNKWGVFPSVSAGWRISKEDFLADSDLIDNMKLRVSWGKLGNQAISANQYSAIYSLGQNYSFGGSLAGGAAQNNLPNPDVTWETSTQTDVGLDVEMLNGKWGFVIDYFNKLTDDILRPVNISSVIGGLSAPTVNLASVRNKGFEFALTHKNNIGELTYGLGLNFTTIDNEVTKIPAPSIGGFTRTAVGSPINEFYTLKMIGIFQDPAQVAASAQPTAKPGDVMYDDFDNNGVIDGDDRQSVGSSIPKLTYGLNLDLGYKDFDFSVLFQGVEDILALTEFEQQPFFNGAGIPKFWVNNAWTPENPNNKYPRITESSTYNTNAWQNSSFLLEDASFLRIKNLQLGYTLPDSVLSKFKITKLRVYLNAQNPVTFTKYRGLDPEKNVFAGRGSYSNVSIYSFGINLSL